MASGSLKRNYHCVPSLQQFYTGGPFAVSSDGSFLTCACDDKIKIVDSSNASIRATLEADTESVTALALSPDDKLLFSASHSRLIRVWDLSSLKCLRSWKGHEGPVMGMACHSSGGLLATAGADRKVLVWDVDGGFCTHYLKGHKGVITSIMFHPDPNCLFLFSGSDDATVRVWDLSTKKCMAVLEKHFSAVTSLALSEDGWTLLSAGRDKVVNLWDLHSYSFKMTVPTYEVLETVCVIHNGTGFSACLNKHNGKKKKTGSPPVCFLTTGERGIVRIWSSEGAVCIYEQRYTDATVSSDEDDVRRGFTSAVILPSDQGLLCVTADQQFLFYCPAESLEGSFHLNLNKRLVGYNEEIVDLKFLGEEEQFLAVATNLEQVRVYDLASMSCSYVLAGHADIVLCLDTCVLSSGKTLIVTGSKDNTVRVWEDNNRCSIGVGTGHMGAVGAVAFSKKRKSFFVSGSYDRTLKVWSLDGLLENGSEVINLKVKAVVAAHDKDINSLAVAPNDNLVCSGSQDRTACIWRLPDLVSVVVLRGHKRGIWSVEFSPVDQCVITSSGDRTIKIWAISDGSCLKTFEGHTSSVLRASFLTRGTQFVSCGADGLVKLWTIKTNECIATYDEHEAKVWALAVGKKTEMLATGGGDAVVNLWHDCTAADKEEAFRREEEGVLKGQEMENAVSVADYTKAIQLAFELRRPHKLFDLFAELCREREAEDQIEKALHVLGKEEIHLLFEYVREWNTKPKLAHVAQFVLFQVFNILPPTEIIEIKGISELLEGLIPYSQRHFSRIDRLLRSTFLLDYTLTGMSVIDPETDSLESKDGSMLHSDDVQASMPFSAEIDGREQNQGSTEVREEKVSSKKRKSSKSRSGAKKFKETKYVDGSAVALQA
ncbi:protein TORMOZ EMBRYO DEFECTIVE [Magnolia sinica]|uniref:protein TORMOZ EMBRYO DEFECTIVE n=1 Tax=Magnolia sinica TaxID=86752 RepID=UPI00265AC5C9|nr:protein TORMOZ EMBRYO DEFECTIVE [Magnolia sinica]XP_058084923.1 protein TORMOZ EMBRYO DEFECTIVE [Magnolia sinica]